ncbi:DNA repair ATPase [Oleiphilus messinensis]|uniref:DNA repair ATPase n=1 Tax=Oleiphilus messinensis TaxID=141451 RepID=A0A1Y0I741_9GAMM|nr:DUF2799 domain-containing protein [Oleiphilus messinensis]ARU55596.1 DNA repair ATPase [Oleiphilus messinensis]
MILSVSPWRKLFAVALLGPVLISGCATLSKDECLHAQWYTIGFEDGAAGRKASYLGEHRESCAEYGVAPDFETYMSGRDAGIESYCTEHNGRAIGEAGSQYHGVCPPHLEPGFLASFQLGQSIYQLTKEIKQIEQEIEKGETELLDTRDLIEEKERKLVGENLTRDHRQKLLNEIKAMERNYGKSQSDLSRLKYRLGELDQSLRELEQY